MQVLLPIEIFGKSMESGSRLDPSIVVGHAPTIHSNAVELSPSSPSQFRKSFSIMCEHGDPMTPLATGASTRRGDNPIAVDWPRDVVSRDNVASM